MTAGWFTSWTGAIPGSSASPTPPRTPIPVLRIYAPTAVPIVGAVFKNTALREYGVVEAIQTVYMIEPRVGLYINLKDSSGQVPKTRLSFLKATTYQSRVVCLLLWSLPVLCEYGGQFQTTQISSRGCEQTITHNPASRNTGEMGLGKTQAHRGNPELTIHLHVGSGPCVRCRGLTCEYRGALDKLTALMNLSEKPRIMHCG